MRKGPKIIQITGFRGLMIVAFVVTCLCAGFIVFPAIVAMHTWNYISSYFYNLPKINIWQGILLWAMIALSIYTINKNKKTISFVQPTELSDEEMNYLMKRIKLQKQAQKINTILAKAEDLNLIKKEKTPANKDDQEQTSNNIEKHL